MRQTLQNLFGFELSSGLRWIIAFAFVLVLVALLGFFLRRMSGGRLKFKGQGGGRTRQPRLGVVDVHDLDRQRQLVLVRRDNVEHLVMIGGASDVVIETNIMRSGARVAMAPPSEPLAERPLPIEPLAMPEPSEGPRRAPPQPIAPAESLPPRTQAPQPAAQPPRTSAPAPARSVAALAATGAAIGTGLVRDAAPAASPSELGDMARQLEEALKRPFSAVRPGSPGAARAEPETPKPAAPAPSVQQAAPAPKPPRPPEPAVAPPAQAHAALDMESELEIALGLKPVSPTRPAAAEVPLVAPPVFAPAKPAPEPAKTEEKPAAKAPEPAKAPPQEAAKPAPAKPVKGPVDFDDVLAAQDGPIKPAATQMPAQAKPADAKSVEAKAPEARAPEAKPEEPKRSEPSAPEPAPSEPKPAEAGPAEPKPAAKPQEDDPFSVDAIEAEFARLLGRDPKKG
jgi:hypothetical protein